MLMNAGVGTGVGLGHAQTQIDTELLEIDEILRDYDESIFATQLGKYVEDRFIEAARHRVSLGVDAEMDRCVRAYNSKYDPEDMELVAKTSDVYMPITNTKCRGLQSWVTDILSNAEDKPWTLTPTPDPDIPQWMEDQVVERLGQEAMTNGVGGDFVALAKQAKDLAKKHAAELSAEATRRMEDRIYDQLLAAGWRKSFRAFVDDLSVFPTAIMFGPSVQYRETIRWRGGEAVTTKEPAYMVRRVNPKDFYPAPNAETVEDATYLCEIRPMSVEQLLNMTNLVGVDQSAVRKLIARQPCGYENPNRAGSSHREGEEKREMATTGPSRQYEVIQYYGAVEADVLLRHGMADVDPQGMEEMEVWVCDGIVLRALRNPYPLSRKPYHATSFQRKAGCFWGMSIPTLVRDLQRVANGAVRNMVRNLSYSSGPLGEYDIERLVDEDRIEHFDPYRLFAVRPDYTSGGAAAIKFQNIPNNSPLFIGVYDRFLKEADDVSGIPAYVIGNPNVAGAGRTLGGLSLLMGNAAKGVKRVISDIDKDVIEPIIETLYQLNLLYSEDQGIKSDAQIVARGASGLLQRELSQARSAEVLPFLIQGLNLGVADPSSIARVMQDMLQSLGYPPDLVTDPEEQRRLLMAAQQAGLSVGGVGGNAPGSTPNGNPISLPGQAAGVLPPAAGAPPPTLDGRSTPPPDPAAAERF